MKLEIQHIDKLFEERFVLNDANCLIDSFKILAILGPSGSGKSTLLRLIGGLDTPNNGKLFLNDQEILFSEKSLLDHRRSIGHVFQSFNLFPHLTVLENIELPLSQVHGLLPEEATERAIQFLTRFNLQEHANKKPAQLSGGQRQRVAIVRAISIKAKLILFDEPTSALDPYMTSEVLDMIVELKNMGTYVILISHHIGFVKKTADQVIFLDEGKILEYGSTSDFFSHPKTAASRQFLANVLKY